MEVIIKNIEMPKNCDCCHFLRRIEQDDDHPAFYYCQIENIGEPITHIPMSSIDIDKRQNWCPLEPVVHGHWVDEPDRYFHWHCSECEYTISGAYREFHYCPKCGAKMDGDRRMTNAEQIRAMTDEELADFIAHYMYCHRCWKFDEEQGICTRTSGCNSAMLEWLKQEVDDAI